MYMYTHCQILSHVIVPPPSIALHLTSLFSPCPFTCISSFISSLSLSPNLALSLHSSPLALSPLVLYDSPLPPELGSSLFTFYVSQLFKFTTLAHTCDALKEILLTTAA